MFSITSPQCDTQEKQKKNLHINTFSRFPFKIKIYYFIPFIYVWLYCFLFFYNRNIFFGTVNTFYYYALQ